VFAGVLQVLLQRWETVAAFVLLVAANFAAIRLARRPDCGGRLGRRFCGIYFSPVDGPAGRHPESRLLRPAAMFALIGLLLFSLTPRAVVRPRPPLIDARLLSRTGYMDYSREHGFFRAPPPAAPGPPNR
jgi:hypothetical protein